MIPPTETTALPDAAPDGMVRNPMKRLLARLTPRHRRALRALALAVLGALLLGSGVLFAWTRELPAFGKLEDYRPLISTRVLGSTGAEVFTFARERRTVVPLQEIPLVLRQAVLAA